MKPLVYKKARRVRQKPVVRMRLHITKGDTVQMIAGDKHTPAALRGKPEPQPGPGWPIHRTQEAQ